MDLHRLPQHCALLHQSICMQPVYYNEFMQLRIQAIARVYILHRNEVIVESFSVSVWQSQQQFLIWRWLMVFLKWLLMQQDITEARTNQHSPCIALNQSNTDGNRFIFVGNMYHDQFRCTFTTCIMLSYAHK